MHLTWDPPENAACVDTYVVDVRLEAVLPGREATTPVQVRGARLGREPENAACVETYVRG